MQQIHTVEYSRVLRKVSWRLLPFMLILYIISYLDRINISFAGAPMRADLHFGEEVFGFGAGIFFLGYCLFGVPSNLALQRVGARKWISLLMIVWGIVSVLIAFVPNKESFFAMRFILGLAESGFFPGMIFYLTKWFPKREHGMAVAKFMSAIPVASVLGSLIAAKILGMPPLLGLAPWKWLFVITGSPSIILGIVVFFYLSDGPSDASWLTEQEKETLASGIERESCPPADKPVRPRFVDALIEPKVWILALLYFTLTIGMYGFQLWLPQIIKDSNHGSDAQSAFLAMIPAVFQALGMVLIAGHSDRTGERRWHLAGAAGCAALGLALAAVVKTPVAAMAALCLTAFGIWGTVGPFWALPTSYLTGTAAAAGIALINSVGNLGGFAGPYIVGWIKSRSADFGASLLFMACVLLFGGVLGFVVGGRKVS